MSLYVLFSILGIKRIQEPNLEYLGQNRVNIENWKRYWDQGLNLGRILKKIYGRCKFLKILVSFNGFRPFLKKGSKKKEFEQLGEFLDFDRFDLLSLIELYHNVKGRISRIELHETCSWLKILGFHIRIGPKISPIALSKSCSSCWSKL